MPNPRLYITDALHKGASLTVSEKQAHYLVQVMRLKTGDAVRLFNGHDGEWHAVIRDIRKKQVTLEVTEQTCPFTASPDIWLLFAPIKAGRIDYLVEKATELGVSRLLPVKTQRTIVSRVNHERLQAHAIEAAEQTQRLDVPVIEPYRPLPEVLAGWDDKKPLPLGEGKFIPLIYGDESGNGAAAAQLLADKQPPLAMLIGPEGGFSPEEFALLKQYDFTQGLSLGPRILRADTAALASLTLLQLYCGDWY